MKRKVDLDMHLARGDGWTDCASLAQAKPHDTRHAPTAVGPLHVSRRAMSHVRQFGNGSWLARDDQPREFAVLGGQQPGSGLQ